MNSYVHTCNYIFVCIYTYIFIYMYTLGRSWYEPLRAPHMIVKALQAGLQIQYLSHHQCSGSTEGVHPITTPMPIFHMAPATLMFMLARIWNFGFPFLLGLLQCRSYVPSLSLDDCFALQWKPKCRDMATMINHGVSSVLGLGGGGGYGCESPGKSVLPDTFPQTFLLTTARSPDETLSMKRHPA